LPKEKKPLQVRLRKTGELIGHTQELKAGTARTLGVEPAQEGIDLLSYDLKVVVHPTSIRREIYFGYAIIADDMEHAAKLPGFKPYGAGQKKTVVVDSGRKRRNKAVAAARNRKAAEAAVASDPLE
jgi:hypothetical protein